MSDKIKKNISWFFIVSLLIYIVFVIFSDFNLVVKSISSFSIKVFFQVIIVILISIFLKFLRWHFYLKEINILIPKYDSVMIFLVGLSMSFSPGKLGELLKSYLLKSKFQFQISITSPVIIAERIIEFTSLIIISIFGAIAYNLKFQYLIFPFLLLILIFFLFRNNRFINLLFTFLGKFKFFRQNLEKLTNVRETTFNLFTWEIFLKMLFISSFAWLFECYSYYLIVQFFVPEVGFIWISVIYLISIIIGSVSMTPGGIGTTEGALTYFLYQQNISENIAVTSALLIRVSTLWFTIIVGFLALMFYKKNNTTKIQLENFENNKEFSTND